MASNAIYSILSKRLNHAISFLLFFLIATPAFADPYIEFAIDLDNPGNYNGSDFNSKFLANTYSAGHEYYDSNRFLDIIGETLVASIDVVGDDDENSTGATYFLAAPAFSVNPLYMVFSPDFKAIPNEGSATVRFNLKSTIKLKAIGLNAINYGKYGEYNNKKNTLHLDMAEGQSVTVNGKPIVIPDDINRQEIKVDLDADEEEVSFIEIKAPAHASLGIIGIKLYPTGEDEIKFLKYDTNDFTNPDGTTPQFKSTGKIRLPYVNVLGLDKEHLQCAIFDNAGNQMNVNVRFDDTDAHYHISPQDNNGKTGDILQEGYYKAAFYNMHAYDLPRYEDGIDFTVQPTIEGMMLNWEKVSFTAPSSVSISVPERTTRQDSNGNTIQHDWNSVLLNGFRPNTTVYWKVVDTNGINTQNDVNPEYKAKRAAVSIPSDFKKLQNLSVNLEGGDQLQLYLQRNGVTSNMYKINYAKADVETMVETATDEEVIRTSYYDLQGRPLNNDRFTGNQLIIRVEHLSDGRIRTSKINY